MAAFPVTVHWASTEPVLQWHSTIVDDVRASERIRSFLARVHVASDVVRECIHYEGRALKLDDCFMDAGICSPAHVVLAASDAAVHSLSAIHPYGAAPWPRQLLDALQQASESMTDGTSAPELSQAGEGGTYFLRGRLEACSNTSGDETPPPPTRPFVAAFKPRDEEALAPNNPKGRRGQFGSPTLRAGIRSGECYAREVAAYMLDHGGAAGVPPTALARAHHTAFYVHDDTDRRTSPLLSGSDTDSSPAPSAIVPPLVSAMAEVALGPPASVEVKIVPYAVTAPGPLLPSVSVSDASPLSMDAAPGAAQRGRGKTGSFQAFVSNASVVEEHYGSIPRLDVDEVQMIAAFDMRVLNADRNTDNILVQVQLRDPPPGSKGLRHRKVTHLKLIPIDHGYILPGDVGVVNVDWCWAEWPQVKLPMTDRVRAVIRAMDADADIARLRSVFPRSILSERCLTVLKLTTAILQRAEAAGLTLADAAAVIARTDFTSHSLMEKWVETAGGMAVVKPLRSNALQRPRMGLTATGTTLTRTGALSSDAGRSGSTSEAFRAGVAALLSSGRTVDASACAHSASRTLARAAAVGHANLKLREAPLSLVTPLIPQATGMAAALDSSGVQVSICLSIALGAGEDCAARAGGASPPRASAHTCMRLNAHSEASVTAVVDAALQALVGMAAVTAEAGAAPRWMDVFNAHGAAVSCGVVVAANDGIGAAVSGMVHDGQLIPVLCADDANRIIITTLAAAMSAAAASLATSPTTLPCMRACERLTSMLEVEAPIVEQVHPIACDAPDSPGLLSSFTHSSSMHLCALPALTLRRTNTTLCPYRTPSFSPTPSQAPAVGTLVTLASYAAGDNAAEALAASLGAAFAKSVTDAKACAADGTGLKLCMRWEDAVSVGVCTAAPVGMTAASTTLTRTYTHVDAHHLRTGAAMRAFMPATAGTPVSAQGSSPSVMPPVLLGLRRNVSMGDREAGASAPGAPGAASSTQAADFETHFRAQMDDYFARLAGPAVAAAAAVPVPAAAAVEVR